ncbi:hypothetical protein pipiens_005833, partial [Culex pipiens pipiens]
MCVASNTNLTPPNNKVVVLDVNLKPVAVHVLFKERHVSAGKRYDIECKSSGSRPEAVISWWKSGKLLKRMNKNFSETGNQSLSVLSFTPVVEDDGKYLTCRAENPLIQDSGIEDKLRLSVHYTPIVTLKMGSSLNPDDIKEGDDIYFDCHIQSNPKPYKLAWYHNGNELHHNVTAGIILSDHSLALQGVSRNMAGEYTCIATNTEGRGASNGEPLRVHYAPVCGTDREELLGALKHETLQLKCEVDASPPAESFHWTFNSSGEQTELPAKLHSSEVSSGGSRSYSTVTAQGRPVNAPYLSVPPMTPVMERLVKAVQEPVPSAEGGKSATSPPAGGQGLSGPATPPTEATGTPAVIEEPQVSAETNQQQELENMDTGDEGGHQGVGSGTGDEGGIGDHNRGA